MGSLSTKVENYSKQKNKNDMAQFFSRERHVQPVGLFQGTAEHIITDGGSRISGAEGTYRDGKDSK